MSNKNRIPEATKRRVMRRDGFRCQRCGRTGREERNITPSGSYHYRFPVNDLPDVFLAVTRIVAPRHGGTTEDQNLKVLCVPCSRREKVVKISSDIRLEAVDRTGILKALQHPIRVRKQLVPGVMLDMTVNLAFKNSSA